MEGIPTELFIAALGGGGAFLILAKAVSMVLDRLLPSKMDKLEASVHAIRDELALFRKEQNPRVIAYQEAVHDIKDIKDAVSRLAPEKGKR